MWPRVVRVPEAMVDVKATLLITSLWLVVSPVSSTRCERGEYLITKQRGSQITKTCLPCPSGSFLPYDNHTNSHCIQCSIVRKDLHEITISNCTPVSDTVIGCELGYFWRRDKNSGGGGMSGECITCSSCESRGLRTIQACQIFSDSVCMPNSEQLTCREGQYITTPSQAGLEECVACPAGTYWPTNLHRNTNCAPCSVSQPENHEIVLKPCTVISDTQIGCKDGYYRDNYDIFGSRVYGECNRCTICRILNMFQTSPCQSFQDTQCSIVEIPLKCNKGQYVSMETNGENICRYCPGGTFQRQDNHSYVSCAYCSSADLMQHEVVLLPCNHTSDAVIGCEPGFFRNNYHPPITFTGIGECEPCTSCENLGQPEAHPCEQFRDAVCGSLILTS